MRITVVSPHRGDAAFALGLAIEAWLQQGHAVEVVNCFTRSEFAPYSDAQSLHANDRMSFVTAVRKREDEAWRKQYSSAKFKLTDLNLKDAPGRLHCSPEEVFGRAVDVSEKVVTKICRAVELSKPDALVLPLGLSAHVDHVSARNAAMAAVPPSIPVAFYEELPYALRATTDAIAAAAKGLSSALGVELQKAFANINQEVVTDAAVLRRRRIALCYDSQIDEKNTMEIAEVCRVHGGCEPLWTNPEWRTNGILIS